MTFNSISTILFIKQSCYCLLIRLLCNNDSLVLLCSIETDNYKDTYLFYLTKHYITAIKRGKSFIDYDMRF